MNALNNLDLPYEIQLNILIHVGYPDVLSYFQTNSVARIASNDDYLWSELYIKDFPTIPRRSGELRCAKMDYLITYNILRTFAEDFTRKYTRCNSEFIDFDKQTNGTFQLLVDYFKHMTEYSSREWQIWANLSDEDFDIITQGGTLRDYNYKLDDEIWELTLLLLQIMLGVNSETFNFINGIVRWDSIRIDYHYDLQILIEKLFKSY